MAMGKTHDMTYIHDPSLRPANHITRTVLLRRAQRAVGERSVRRLSDPKPKHRQPTASERRRLGNPCAAVEADRRSRVVGVGHLERQRSVARHRRRRIASGGQVLDVRREPPEPRRVAATLLAEHHAGEYIAVDPRLFVRHRPVANPASGGATDHCRQLRQYIREELVVCAIELVAERVVCAATFFLSFGRRRKGSGCTYRSRNLRPRREQCGARSRGSSPSRLSRHLPQRRALRPAKRCMTNANSCGRRPTECGPVRSGAHPGVAGPDAERGARHGGTVARRERVVPEHIELRSRGIVSVAKRGSSQAERESSLALTVFRG